MSPLVKRLAVAGVVCAALSLCAASAFGTATGTAADRPPATGSITKTYSLGQCDTAFQCWVCNGPVALDSVTIVVDSNVVGVDAVKFAGGCTGSIGKLTIRTESTDGIKVASGAADIDVGGGSITCTNRFGIVHQDGIQVMGGQDITFDKMTVDCGTANHSAFFVNQGTSSDEVPTDVLFSHGTLKSTGTTVDLGTSKRSGVTGSVVCPSLRIGVPISIPDQPSGGGPAAVKPVDRNNTFPTIC